MNKDPRIEHDLLGERSVPSDCLYGIHTVRALENFPLTGRRVPASLISAYGYVKWACAQVNRRLGSWSEDGGKADAIERACRELAEGLLDEWIVVDPLQGGAGTSLNMNVNELLANRALELLDLPHGRYDRVSPLDDLNLHQSTNDTYPTALKLAAIQSLRLLESQLVALQESFQSAERRFASVVKVGRTQMQDAVLTTLGREMGAYAEALNRDRWRIYKCEERLRVVNLGGTAIGTGLAAPRAFVFQAVDQLRDLSGIGLARAENLVESTQNADVFVEVMGFLKTCACNLFKICSDLRLLSSGPDAGLGEISLPPRQAGSSVMPGKVNPVIPEAVSQAAMKVIGYDASVAWACASGSLELNPFLPLVADCLLSGIDLLARATEILRTACVDGITANEERCRRHVEHSTAVLTALLPLLGYEKASALAERARSSPGNVKEWIQRETGLSEDEINAWISPEAVTCLGTRPAARTKENH